jgi:hypothetical protein
MSEKIEIGKKKNTPAKTNDTFENLSSRDVDPGEVRAIIKALRIQGTEDKDIPAVLTNMGIPKEQAEKYVTITSIEPEEEKVEEIKKAAIATKHKIRKEDVGDFFQAPQEEINLPSRGYFYENNKETVTIKHLTASEDDILYDMGLIRTNEQLDALLEAAIVDKDIRPQNMLTGDRNYILIQLRRTGLGDDYEPGPRVCGSCGHAHIPTIDLSVLKTNDVKFKPDDDGEFSLQMKHLKVSIKFRLLTGKDESILNKYAQQDFKKGRFKISKTLTHKYLLHIMEVNGKRDKVYIKSYVEAMPMQDSKFLREEIKKVEPGLDMEYDFECPKCLTIETKPIPITLKLFYPDAEF